MDTVEQGKAGDMRAAESFVVVWWSRGRCTAGTAFADHARTRMCVCVTLVRVRVCVLVRVRVCPCACVTVCQCARVLACISHPVSHTW